jgi:hypothetical protein
MQLRKANFKNSLSNPEVFRDIKGFEGLYKISYNGFVYSYISDKILKPGLGGAGYYTVALKSNTGSRSYNIHRLVAEAFIPNPENKRTVNHKLGNKHLNHVAWLEWNTHKENNTHATQTGLRKVKITQEVISQILSEHIRGDKEHGAKALAKKFQVNRSTIFEVLNQYKYNNHGNS